MKAAEFDLYNAHMEIHFNPQMWEHGAVNSVLPNGKGYIAAPQEGEDLIDTFAHELAHHLSAQILWDVSEPSKCIGAKHWTPARHLEEEKALQLGKQIALAIRAFMEAKKCDTL